MSSGRSNLLLVNALPMSDGPWQLLLLTKQCLVCRSIKINWHGMQTWLHLAFLSENLNNLPVTRLKEGLMRIVYVHVQILGLNAQNVCANLGLNAHSLGYYAVGGTKKH